uniref:G2/mitotic-specific cyclin-B3 n=1 Tax=Panagrellus redivivus TaxID=6233 RepID=A0A7E4V2R5_PANRE
MISSMILNYPLIAPTPETDPQPFEDLDYLPVPPVIKWNLDEQSTEPENDVAEYAEEIMDYYRQRQSLFKIGKYFDKHIRLDPEVRAEMVNFMAQLTTVNNMFDDILFLAVKLFDLYLDNCDDVIYYKQLKLISSTAVYLAVKYETNHFKCPISEFVKVTDDIFSQKDYRIMEREILKSIGFEVGIPTANFFLARFCKIIKADERVDATARYVSNMALMFYEFVNVKDDILAAGALCLALYTNGQDWKPALDQYTGYTIRELEPVAKALNHMLYKWESYYKDCKAIFTYYSGKKNHYVASIEWLPSDFPPHVDIVIPEYALNV